MIFVILMSIGVVIFVLYLLLNRKKSVDIKNNMDICGVYNSGTSFDDIADFTFISPNDLGMY